MKKYPFLISFALLYWGFNTDNLSIAIIFMILFESHRIIKFRWDFSTKDFNMISVLSTLGSIGYLIYFTNSSQDVGFISSFLKFLPMILFPLNFFYLYSTSEFINSKKLFLLFVANKYSIVHPYSKIFRPDHIFFASLLVGGSISEGIFSFPALILLILPALFFNRSKNYNPVTWIISLASVIILALILQFSISNTFFFIKDLITDLYIDHFMNDNNKHISIGNIGSMKDNFRIELRADIFNTNKPCYHVKDRTFNHYSYGSWQAYKSDTKNLQQGYFEYGETPVDSMRMYFFSSGKKNYLKLPFATGTISGISESQLNINSLGEISVGDPQHLIDHITYSRMDTTINLFSGPNEIDTKINVKDSELISPIIDSLKLGDMPFNKINRTLSNYFVKEYRYSLAYIDQKDHDKLKNFINSKRGHCELFATLSCLIYRELGYPSRYVTGYLISEYNEFEELYVARKKDRHAWIYVNDGQGNWLEYDTTPPDISLNRSKSGFISKIYDITSYVYYRAFMFRKYNNDFFKNILLLSIIPLALFLLYRILKGVKYRGNEKKDKAISRYKIMEELSLIQEKLKNNKIEDHETLLKWFERIGDIFNEKEKLDIVQKLYYQKRYFSEKFTQEHDKELKKNIESL